MNRDRLGRGRWQLAAVLTVVAVALPGCGGDSAEDRAREAASYAAEVAQATERTRRTLADTSSTANYRDAASAAQTTAQYAAAIRAAAEELERATVPGSVAREHRDLVALYRATATRLDGLASQFGGSGSGAELTALAQALSGEVQDYSTREAQLRAAIDRALAGSVAPASTPPRPADKTAPPAAAGS